MAQTLASGTPEAQEAQISNNWAQALRCLVKRRQAIRTASPFTAAIVAVAESWIYTGGVLCYIQERTLRVLDLHRSGSTEIVVGIYGLLQEAVGETRRRQRYKLQLLHYAEGLVTCLYSRARENWLLVFDVFSQRLLPVSPALESTYKIFVRNDADFLYYGTHSEFGEDGFRRWVLKSFDIRRGEWLDQKTHLLDLVGSDIGHSICFEIIDGHFYGLSNQTSFEVNEVDWTSYYHCFCFPVGRPRPEETRRSIREEMWRRQHAEGPIDDRWSFLRLIKNEETSALQVLESRKEWLDRRSSGQRIYYTTDLALGPKARDNGGAGQDMESAAVHATAAAAGPNTSTHASSCGSTGNNPPDSGRLYSSTHVRTNFTLPAKPITRLRKPQQTHIGDDASTALLFTFSKCPVRSYHAASEAFLDLVNDPSPTATPQLKLRAGARYAIPASTLATGSPGLDETLPHTERIRHLYKHAGANEITFWPPAAHEGPDEAALESLDRIVNPPSHMGNVRGTWDERSFVYSTGSNADGVQAVVFLGFDPTIKLRGVQDWGEREGARGYAAWEDEAAGSSASDLNGEAEPAQAEVCGGALLDTDEALQDKGKEAAMFPEADDFAATWAMEEESSPQTMTSYSSGNEDFDCADGDATLACSSPHMILTQQPCNIAEGELPWVREQPAMYQEISFGFNGLPDFTRQREMHAVGNTDPGRETSDV